MDDVTKQALLSVVRSLLVAVGSILIAHGVVNAEQWANLLGAITTAVPVVWGIYDKYKAERLTREREAAAYAAGSTNMITTNRGSP